MGSYSRSTTEEDEHRNIHLIQFFGLQRGGNHGVVAWIAQQYSSPIVFLNNVKVSGDPFRVKAIPFPNAIPQRRLSPAEADHLRARRKEVLLLGFENARLRQIARAEKERALFDVALLGTSRVTKRVLLLRDFYNWVASNVRVYETRRGGFSEKAATNHVTLWLSYAREFAGRTALLGTANVIKISYNRWLDNDEYRAGILRSVGIPVVNNSRSIVPQHGGGSSFDGTTYSGNAEKMDVLNRWEYLKDKRPLLEIFERRREQIDRYNKALFGLTWPFP